MTIPVQSSEVVEFTPDSLKDIENPPVFRLRAPDERHMRRFRAILMDEGVEHHDDKSIIAKQLEAIGELWDEEYAVPTAERFKTYLECEKQGIEIPDDEVKWFNEFERLLLKGEVPASRALRVMRRENIEHNDMITIAVLSTIIIGWKEFDLKFERDEGYLKIDCISKIAKKLADIEKETGGDDAFVGLALMQLSTACFKQSRLIKDEEKNSPAPLPNSSDETKSTTNPLAVGASSEDIGADKTTGSSSQPNQTPKSEVSVSNSDDQKTI